MGPCDVHLPALKMAPLPRQRLLPSAGTLLLCWTTCLSLLVDDILLTNCAVPDKKIFLTCCVSDVSSSLGHTLESSQWT